MEQQEYDEEKMTLKVIEGGKSDKLGGGTFDPPSKNWLSKLEIGTVFLIRDRKTSEPGLPMCKLLEKTEHACRLSICQTEVYIRDYVETALFSQKYILVEVLGIHRGELLIVEEPKERL